MKILLAIDGSPASLRSTQYILEHADVFGTQPDATLITVHLPVPTPRARAWLGKDALQQYYDEESDIALSASRAAFAAQGKSAVELRRVGDPATEIATAAKEIGAQMIVMGTHGRSALATLVMGSVATKVVAQSHVPVLLIK
jgi:nucleotide-binding universal stress UspA family protein